MSLSYILDIRSRLERMSQLRLYIETVGHAPFLEELLTKYKRAVREKFYFKDQLLKKLHQTNSRKVRRSLSLDSIPDFRKPKIAVYSRSMSAP